MRDYQCEECQQKFAHRNNLQYHRLSAHGDGAPIVTCPACQKSVTANNMARHRRTHEAPQHHCPKCNTSFNDRSNFKRHVSKCIQAWPLPQWFDVTAVRLERPLKDVFTCNLWIKMVQYKIMTIYVYTCSNVSKSCDFIPIPHRFVGLIKYLPLGLAEK